jgi:GntR family transcriptional regulator/MocR family aminotransferase
MGKIKPQILLTYIVIDRTLKKPIYKQLYEQLKDGMLKGLLKPGDRMPSSREMGREFNISRNAVIQVFEQLEMEGFLDSKTGAGTFISAGIHYSAFRKKELKNPASSPARALAREKGLHHVFSGEESSNEPMLPFQQSVPSVADFPFAIWSKITTAVYKRAGQLHLGYDDAQGYLPLRQALANHLRISRSINCSADHILIVNGTKQALNLCAELLLNNGDQCWMEDPGYMGAKLAIKRFGGELCPVPVNAGGIDLDYAIERYPKARLAYITPSHQFPLGSTMLLSERIKLLNWAAAHDMWIIEDDYDSEFRYNGRPVPALQGIDVGGNVIYSGTFSKVLLPALRIGYMVFPSKEIARKFTVAKAVTDGQGAAINQAIVADFITEGHFSRHIRRMRVLYKEAQDQLISLINIHLKDKLVPAPVETGMHLVAWLPAHIDAEIVVAEALKAGIFISTVSQYALTFKYPQGLILGFTGFLPGQMEAAVEKLRKVVVKL